MFKSYLKGGDLRIGLQNLLEAETTNLVNLRAIEDDKKKKLDDHLLQIDILKWKVYNRSLQFNAPDSMCVYSLYA